jgi:hypothetical protein
VDCFQKILHAGNFRLMSSKVNENLRT